MFFTLRPYQNEAIEAVYSHLCNYDTNPCVSLPTGSGKSIVMAEMVRRWKKRYPRIRVCILAHRKELIKQNYEKLKLAASDLDIGIFSASLNKKNYKASILFAGIDSIYKKHEEFWPFDLIFVDEAHRIPVKGEGKYRTFIQGCKQWNDALRVIGFTATPFRMDCGQVCHRDHILNVLCYEAKLIDLINDGYLCNLRSKVGTAIPSLSDVRRNGRGDYVIKSLAKATNKEKLVEEAVAEAVSILNAENRQSVLFFCVDVHHCNMVSRELYKHGILAPPITAHTPQQTRDKILNRFRNGKLRAICNVQVLTEGFDVPGISGIVLFRPTLSAGLYSQMVGRGLRTSATKQDCLVLDFAGCIDEHGPIDLLCGHPVVAAVCKQCRESFSRAIKRCPVCGWEIPKQEIEELERKEIERRMHDKKASQKPILSNEPYICIVDDVYVTRHKKEGYPDSVCITFRCGLDTYRLWLTCDHSGWAGQNAKAWYRRFFPVKKSEDITVDSLLENMFFPHMIKEEIKTITVQRKGKYCEVVNYNEHASASSN